MEDQTFEGQIKTLPLDLLVTVTTRSGGRVTGGVATSPDDALTLMVTRAPVGVDFVSIRLNAIESFKLHLGHSGCPLGLFQSETGHTYTGDLTTAEEG